MIQNERQYEVTKKKLGDLQRALETSARRPAPVSVPEMVWRGHRMALWR